MLFYYLFNYSVSRKNLEKELIKDITQKDELIYGEVPYCTLAKILKTIPIKKEDVFFDLGCGRGKTVFFVSQFYSCKAVGIDVVPFYLKAAKYVAERLKLNQVDVAEKNILDCDLSAGSIFLLSWTCFSDKTSQLIEEKLEKELDSGSYVITTSKCMNSSKFILKKHLFEPLSWGKGNIYIYQKITN